MSVDLSKKLAKILRHDPNIKLMDGGYAYVDDLLKRRELNRYTVADVEEVVETSDKQRFKLITDQGRLKIRATQGHSRSFTDSEKVEITVRDARRYSAVIHGTSYTAWASIEKQGLHRRKRNHIHFAPGETGNNEVISGMPVNCRVKIYLDLEKAIEDGIPFYKASNNVILSPGDSRGYILPKYFKQVKDIRTGEQLDLPDLASLRF